RAHDTQHLAVVGVVQLHGGAGRGRYRLVRIALGRTRRSGVQPPVPRVPAVESDRTGFDRGRGRGGGPLAAALCIVAAFGPAALGPGPGHADRRTPGVAPDPARRRASPAPG